mgnify:FL=1|jgi:hypothetical protein
MYSAILLGHLKIGDRSDCRGFEPHSLGTSPSVIAWPFCLSLLAPIKRLVCAHFPEFAGDVSSCHSIRRFRMNEVKSLLRVK